MHVLIRTYTHTCIYFYIHLRIHTYTHTYYAYVGANIPNYPDTDYEWPGFFHMPVLMLMLITLLNDGTLIAIGYDNVNPRKVCKF